VGETILAEIAGGLVSTPGGGIATRLLAHPGHTSGKTLRSKRRLFGIRHRGGIMGKLTICLLSALSRAFPLKAVLTLFNGLFIKQSLR
jgi:hypothetical protein